MYTRVALADQTCELRYKGKSDYIIQNVVGCGPFQVLLFASIYGLTMFSQAFFSPFMMFGNYNPGWRCLDSNSSSTFNGTNSSTNTAFTSSTFHSTNSNSTHAIYIMHGQCSIFDSCQHVEFRPGTSTIVTEWGLLCQKAWIAKIIISLQYIGMLVGTAFAGHLGDAIGRKTTMYAAQTTITILTLASIFSPSWQVFATIRFLTGLAASGLLVFYYTYMVEFVTTKWRSPLPNIPYWPISCVIFILTCLLFKDWRHIQITGTVIAGVSIIPALWLPESPRWLEVKNKTAKFENAMKKIAKMNKKTLPPLKDIHIVTGVSENGGHFENGIERKYKESEDEKAISEKNDEVRYNIFHLFKPAYRKYTFLLAVPWFSMSLIFFALGFGVKELSGDFYVNSIIMFAFEIPFTPISMFLPNIVGRKPAGMGLSGVSGLCLLAAACCHKFTSGYAKTTGVLILAVAGRITISGFWGVIMTYTAEIYPTVVRGVGTSWGNFMIRISGVVAPFLIPDDESSFFVCYVIMAGVAILCTCVVVFLPETKGRQLRDIFRQHDEPTL